MGFNALICGVPVPCLAYIGRGHPLSRACQQQDLWSTDRCNDAMQTRPYLCDCRGVFSLPPCAGVGRSSAASVGEVGIEEEESAIYAVGICYLMVHGNARGTAFTKRNKSAGRDDNGDHRLHFARSVEGERGILMWNVQRKLCMPTPKDGAWNGRVVPLQGRAAG